MLETPVAFFIFNRPDLTARVFESIRAQKPRQLLVVADGPRHENEAELCHQTREVIGSVDWPCEVHTCFAEENLGCRDRVSSGLNWVFEKCETAIILEDDCLPHPDFFRFCEKMLDHYRNVEQVMHIAGSNFNPDFPIHHSHYFSHYAQMWGWATWQRAWRHYDVEMKNWPHYRDNNLLPLRKLEKKYWTSMFNQTASGVINTWDYQWQFDVFRQRGLVVTPRTNLVSNLGFDARATHTTDASSRFSRLQYGVLGQLDFPTYVERNSRADKEVFEIAFAPYVRRQALPFRIARRIRALLSSKQ